MAKEGELKRVDLKVNVSCCDGCRRKVMKAMSLKGVLRTEIHPTLDLVTVVGNVDTAVLVRKLAKVRKIAEVVQPASPEEKKKREEQGGRDRDVGDWTAPPAPVMAGEKSKRKDDGGDWMEGEKSKSKGDGKDSGGEKPAPAAPSKKECHKCAKQQQQKQQSARGGGDHVKAPSSSKGDAESAFKQENDGLAAEAKPSPPDHAPAAAHQHYHRAEPPSMAVPMQYMLPTMPYYAAAANVAAPSYYNGGGGGYYATPPPPPAPTMPMPWQPPHQQLVRAQPSRFDVDYFNEDNAVGCHVM